jgi:2-polyprenyl-3-methyl-5-hydroxy-6-metoxy-1,4-benzoquinol methylase
MPTIDRLKNEFDYGYDSGDILAHAPDPRRREEEQLIGGCYREEFSRAIHPYIKSDQMTCPLCKSKRTAVNGLKFSGKDLINQWSKFYQVDVSHSIDGQQAIALWTCECCGLSFFYPSVNASEILYEKLSKLPWYYMEHKWEFDIALSYLRTNAKVLEIGCGKGTFLKRARDDLRCDVIGIEFNQWACSQIPQGIRVYQQSLKEISQNHTDGFDDICMFQVLEHITDLRKFLEDCLQLLKPEGKLIISVPNCSGFLRHAKNDLLNLPPHHSHWWNEESLKSIARIYNLSMVDMLFEPLATYHLDYYSIIQSKRICQDWMHSTRIRTMAQRMIKWLVQRPFIRSRLKGHTIFVCLQKRNERSDQGKN